MKITVRFVEPKLKKKVKVKAKKQGRGFWAAGQYISHKQITGSKWLNRKEKEMLLGMCSGTSVKCTKRVKYTKYPKAVARYYVDGLLYCDGSCDEVCEFYGV
jgi:hypothetical protein